VVEEATEDNYRIDIVVANTLGELVLIQGEESEDVAVQPIVPANTLFLCSFNIFGNTIGDNSEPVLGLDFVKKIYYSEFQFIAPIDVISLPLAGMTGFLFEVGDFNIKGFSVENSAELYEGKEFSLKNNSNDVISLEHFNTNVDIWFNFFDEANSTLQPKEIKYFRFTKLRGLELKGSNLESTSTPTLLEVTEAGNETTVKTIFRTSETEWVEIGGDNNGIAVYNDEFGSLPTPKSIIDIGYNGLGVNSYDTDTGESTGFAGIGGKTLQATEIVGGVAVKSTAITPDKIVKRINGTTSFEIFLPSENNDLNGSKVISTNTTASNAINYLAVANLTMTDITPPSEGAFYEVTVINGTATIGGVGYTVGQKVFRHYHSGSWRTFVTQNANSLSKIVIKDTTSSAPVTGSTLNTLAKTYEIQGGVFDGNDAFNLKINAEKNGVLGTATIRVYVNTENNFATATLYSTTLSASAAIRDIPVSRLRSNFKGTNLMVVAPASGLTTDLNQGFNAPRTALSLNPANTFFVFVAIQNANAGDSTTIEILHLTT
jgi:hypothetical protein